MRQNQDINVSWWRSRSFSWSSSLLFTWTNLRSFRRPLPRAMKCSLPSDRKWRRCAVFSSNVFSGAFDFTQTTLYFQYWLLFLFWLLYFPQMTKKIKKLEKETTLWRTKWETNNQTLLQMAEEVRKHAGCSSKHKQACRTPPVFSLGAIWKSQTNRRCVYPVNNETHKPLLYSLFKADILRLNSASCCIKCLDAERAVPPLSWSPHLCNRDSWNGGTEMWHFWRKAIPTLSLFLNVKILFFTLHWVV